MIEFVIPLCAGTIALLWDYEYGCILLHCCSRFTLPGS